MFKIYNQSSERMPEIENASIDLIFTSPPYNIGTIYGDNQDNLNFSDFKKLLGGLAKESFRTLKPSGRLIVECSDTIGIGDLYVELAGLIQSLCLKEGFTIEKRFINFISSKNGVELLDHGWDEDYSTRKNAHSNCHQIMVFSKTPIIFEPEAEILYINYQSIPEHPCPTPSEIYNLFLDKYFQAKQNVLDPFMGTAVLGVEVLKRGGNFFGYELDSKIFQVAQDKLSQEK